MKSIAMHIISFQTSFLVICLIQIINARKNILFLVADDMRPNLGVYNSANKPRFRSPSMSTPNLDSLARKSMLFDNAYCQQALCAPSRTSFLTGRRPDTTRVTGWNYWRTSGGNFATIPQFFKENGYRTIGGGKIFHQNNAKVREDQKYSWTDKYHHAYRRKDPFTRVWKGFSNSEVSRLPLEDTLEANYIIQKLREVAKTKNKPFFIAYGTRKPHMPFNFPSKYLKLYPVKKVGMPYNYYPPKGMPWLAWNNPPVFHYADCKKFAPNKKDRRKKRLPSWKVKQLRRAYYATISFVDHELGRVLNEVKTLGLENDTIIAFLSDHGWQLGEHAEWAKQTNFEIANRVPLMIKVPGVTDKGLRTQKLTELVDVFPTLVEAAGFTPLKTCPTNSAGVKLCTEGTSLLPLFNNTEREDWKKSVFWQYPKSTTSKGAPRKMGYTIRTERYRFTKWVYIKRLGGKNYEPNWWRSADLSELYDLSIDPQENVNRYL